LLQGAELQWSYMPEDVEFTGAGSFGSDKSIKGIQLRSFRSQPTDFTYNPS